ncbi:MAG TPA: hypothetical protein DDX39_02360 [Bacteroidales bacterium]|nr:MAG: hypothetical protein A2W98_05565 [Bacteroidetes bacterium GWF2_33_38]HBF87458.1 hypothetical protein [Bacteroidales bacterium]
MEENRKNILSKVAELFQKYGIKSVTMDDIARELSVSKKTLYNYFTDKNDLVKKFVAEVLDNKSHETIFLSEHLNAIEELIYVNKHVNQMLKDYNPAMFYDLRKYYPETHNEMIKIRRGKIHNAILANLKKGKIEGIYRKEMDEVIIAKLHVSRIDSLIENKYFTINEFTSPQFTKEIFTYHIRGIANEKGIKIFEDLLKNENHNE